FRYQLMSAHGLPIEGSWYTYTFRNAIITRADSGNYATRSLQELRYLAHRGGGDKIPKEPGKSIEFGGVGIQYFASLVVVDNEQEDRSFLAWARPTVETAVVKGDVTSVAEDGKSFKVKVDDKTELTMQLRGGPVVLQNAALVTGEKVKVVYRTDEYE